MEGREVHGLGEREGDQGKPKQGSVDQTTGFILWTMSLVTDPAIKKKKLWPLFFFLLHYVTDRMGHWLGAGDASDDVIDNDACWE